jgi:hypothetical protein
MLRAVQACPDTLTGARDRALLLSFSVAGRACEPAGLVLGDIQLQERGLVVGVKTTKSKHSIRDAKVPWADDEQLCPGLARLARAAARRQRRLRHSVRPGVPPDRPLETPRRRDGP